jgi:hypothetical protein
MHRGPLNANDYILALDCDPIPATREWPHLPPATHRSEYVEPARLDLTVSGAHFVYVHPELLGRAVSRCGNHSFTPSLGVNNLRSFYI